jgi:hypothetical protein
MAHASACDLEGAQFMAVTPWPSNVPLAFLNNSYQESFASNLLRSDMDSGPAKVRRRTSAGVRPLEGQLLLSGAERAVIEAFFTNTLRSGALPFSATHPRTGASILLRFVEPPAYGDFPTATEAYYTVSLKLEVLP